MSVGEDNAEYQRLRADMLQGRLSERRQECAQLREELMAIRKKYEILELETDELQTAYDALREKYISRTLSRLEFEDMSLLDFSMYRLGLLMQNICVKTNLGG